MRILGTLAVTGSLLLSAAAMSGAKTKPMPAAKKANGTIYCPFMKVKTPKSKAVKVTAANGKSMYVCCKGCVAPAKKLLMTKKAANETITCPVMHKTMPKSQAIKVTAANGKSTYICCQGCEEGAKKQLLAKN